MEKIGFLFEANYNTGGGHFWRCFNLSKILKKRSRKFFFISENLNESFVNILKKENINYFNVNSLKKYSNIKKALKKINLDVLISDYYGIKEKEKKKIKQNVKTFIVIDDFTNKKHYCDVFINNNFLTNTSKLKIKKLNPKSKLLLGINYFIQPHKFLVSRKKVLNKKIEKIFVFFGSSDPSNETIKFIKAIENFNDLKFYILIGKINKNYKKIKAISNNKKNIKIFYNLTNIQTLKLIKNKDLSFGAGGINLFERLFQGLPCVVICNANNQKEALLELKKRKVIHYLGYKNEVSKRDITKCLNAFLKKKKIINNLLKNTYINFNIKHDTFLLKSSLNNIIKKNAQSI